MDSDSISPVGRYFQDNSVVVRKSTNRYDEAILWLSFYETDQHVSFAVYDGKANEYTHDFPRMTSNLGSFVQSVEHDYGVKISQSMIDQVSTFISLRDESFGVNVELNLDSFYCDQCGGTAEDTFRAFYFPPIPTVGPASLGLEWSYGCYGGENLAGSFDDASFVQNVLDVAERAARNGENRDETSKIYDFIAKVKELL